VIIVSSKSANCKNYWCAHFKTYNLNSWSEHKINEILFSPLCPTWAAGADESVHWIGYGRDDRELGLDCRWVASRPVNRINQPPIQWVGLMEGFSLTVKRL